MHELISDSAIDPLVTSQSVVCYKRTRVSHLVVSSTVCTDIAWFSEHNMLVVLQ